MSLYERPVVKRETWTDIDGEEVDIGHLAWIGYDKLVEPFGDILAVTEEDNYQGDSLYLIRRGDDYGVLCFGWGSCSGCDALEACETKEEVYQLQDDLWRGITWFDSAAAVKEYVLSLVGENEDPSRHYFWDEDMTKDFYEKVLAAL